MSSALKSFCLDLEKRDIEVIEHKCLSSTPSPRCKTCILGVLLSENGIKIEQYMLSWLMKEYDVFSIRQPLPGVLFEYPALRFAQLYSTEFNTPILYLHTKGAANPRRQQRRIINMWRHEFVDLKAEYEKRLDNYDILLPYSGPQNITWLNGFIATVNAFSSISPIPILENRYLYEILFKGSSLSCYGRRISSIQRLDSLDSTNLMYKDINRFSPSFSPLSNSLHNLIADL